MNESVDARVWREHEQWLDVRARLALVRERWTDDEWAAVRLAADRRWDAHRSTYYVYGVLDAVREHQSRRIENYLAFEASHGAEWLTDVLERTATP